MGATLRQLDYIERLAAEREIADPDRERLISEIDEGRTDLAATGERWTEVLDGRKVIDYLLHRPKLSLVTAPRPSQPAPLGVYVWPGDQVNPAGVYVIKEFHPSDKPKGVKVRYARYLKGLTLTQGDRMNEEGEAVRWQEVRAPGMQWKLTPAHAMPMADVKRFSQVYRHCLVCSARLKVKESIDRAMGPVCYGRQSALLGI